MRSFVVLGDVGELDGVATRILRLLNGRNLFDAVESGDARSGFGAPG